MYCLSKVYLLSCCTVMHIKITIYKYAVLQQNLLEFQTFLVFLLFNKLMVS